MTTNLTTVSSLFDKGDNFQLEVENAGGIPLEATRHIFTAGDYIDPARKTQLEHLRRGGDELLANPCLIRTPNRFLPRCAITPLEIGGEALPVDLWPTEGISSRPKLKVKGEKIAEAGGRFFPEVFLYPRYPGEMIRDAVDEGTDSRGIIEITYLRGIDWNTGEAQAIQSIIFPDDWKLPVELRLVEEQINRAADANTTTIKEVCGEMLDACDKFRRYATTIVSRQNELVAAGPHPITRFAYFYTPTCRSFAAQLEIKLIASTQETVGAEVARAIAGMQTSQPIDLEMLKTAIGETVRHVLAAEQARTVEVANPVIEADSPKPRGRSGQFTKKAE